MAELITIARPYAKAAFEYALEKGALAEWSNKLAYAAAVSSNETMAELLDAPQFTSEEKAEIFVSVCEGSIDEAGKNYIFQLAQNKRVLVLPEIYTLFAALVAEEEKTVDVTVKSAYELTEEQSQKITAALKQRLGREVILESEVDSSLIGGLIIRAGDMVIDGSTRGKIAKLDQAVNH
jgi:F-type H+-transporting ATPase subunit delta